MTKALWIEIEGIDGAGKSTQVELLRKRLEQSGQKTQVLRSPGGTEFGEAMRPIILGPIDRPAGTDLLVIAGMMHANAVQARAERENNITTIFDRGLSSFYGYQSADELPRSAIDAVLGAMELDPVSEPPIDVHVLLDVEYTIARERLADKKLDRWEQLGEDYFDKVRQLYLRRPYGEMVIDASGSIEQVHERIWNLIQQRLTNGGERG